MAIKSQNFENKKKHLIRSPRPFYSKSVHPNYCLLHDAFKLTRILSKLRQFHTSNDKLGQWIVQSYSTLNKDDIYAWWNFAYRNNIAIVLIVKLLFWLIDFRYSIENFLPTTNLNNNKPTHPPTNYVLVVTYHVTK